jgi:hypothetical protein
MGDMGEIFREWNDHKKEVKARNLENAFAGGTDGWTLHSSVHWSRVLLGDRLDFWPSTKKFRWRNRTRIGDHQEVENFIRNREREAEGQT